MSFNVGDIVRISKSSEFYESSDINNPINTDGVVGDNSYYVEYPIQVTWDNGYTNVYREHDLVHSNKNVCNVQVLNGKIISKCDLPTEDKKKILEAVS